MSLSSKMPWVWLFLLKFQWQRRRQIETRYLQRNLGGKKKSITVIKSVISYMTKCVKLNKQCLYHYVATNMPRSVNSFSKIICWLPLSPCWSYHLILHLSRLRTLSGRHTLQRRKQYSILRVFTFIVFSFKSILET